MAVLLVPKLGTELLEFLGPVLEVHILFGWFV